MVGKAAFALLGLTTLAAFSSGEAVIDDLPICVVDAEWVQDNPEALPTTLEGFADFSRTVPPGDRECDGAGGALVALDRAAY